MHRISLGGPPNMTFNGFDIFMILFTIVIVWAFFKVAKTDNLFAKGFAGVSLATFLLMDLIMVFAWFGIDFDFRYIKGIFS
jgi:hypothetical protein